MSDFNVYVVNAVTGQILQRFTAAEGHKRFGDKYLPLITRQRTSKCFGTEPG
jgi:hypothetical protein